MTLVFFLPDVAVEVAGYAGVAKQIIDLAVFGAAQNRSYRRLADFTDTIGNRVSGSQNLELAIKYMYKALTQDGLDVHLGEWILVDVSLDEAITLTALLHPSPLQSQSKSLTG